MVVKTIDKKDLDRAKKVFVIKEYRSYDGFRTVDWYGIEFEKVDKDLWTIKYLTSRPFEYCDKYGQFRSCSTCIHFDRRDESCAISYKMTTTDSLKSLLENENYEEIKIILDNSAEINY